MLDQATRTAILRLHEEGHGTRAIARALGISRGAARRVVEAAQTEVPAVVRAEKAEPYREQILELLARCKGNLVRVHEELVVAGAVLSYQTLTAYCRRHGLGHEPIKPAGQYDFEPGQEMQHDTSPHEAVIGGTRRRVQTAALVLCFSRMLFFQHYPRFTRFECKVFLTEALLYFEGAGATCMIDNTHVVVLNGTGRDMVPVPEMAAYAERFGFVWQAHEKGDANRSARVERPFDYIENNFLAGREFADWNALNQQARAWCDKVNATPKRHLHASPRELFATERLRLRPLPIWVPEVYLLHHRIVDTEGYVNVQANRYSVPWQLIGRQVEARETKDKVVIFEGPRQVAEHDKVLEPGDARVTRPEHRPRRGEGIYTRNVPTPEERELASAGPELVAYLALLKKRGRSLRRFRQLVRIVRDYPREPVLSAIRVATHYGLDDMERLETLVLRHIAREFFPMPPESAPGEGALPEPPCSAEGGEDEDRPEPLHEEGAGDDEGPEPEDDDDR
jgi:transposase